MGGNYNYMASVSPENKVFSKCDLYRRQSYVLFDQVFWRGTAGQINRWRRNTLGLPGTSLDRMEPHKVPFLYNFSPTVVPPPLDWPEWIRITGEYQGDTLLRGMLMLLQVTGSSMTPTSARQSGRLRRTSSSSWIPRARQRRRLCTSASAV